MNRGSIKIVVSGHPVAWKRAGLAALPSGKVSPPFTPKKVRKWQEDARHEARIVMGPTPPLTGCVAMSLVVYLAVPRSWAAWKRDAALAGHIMPSGRPDLSNFTKNAEDALNGVVWLDDAQIVNEGAVKRYADFPSVTITARPLAALTPKAKKLEVDDLIAEFHRQQIKNGEAG